MGRQIKIRRSKQIIDIVNREIERKGISNAELAAKTGLSRQLIGFIRTKSKSCSLNTILPILKTFDYELILTKKSSDEESDI